MRKENGVFTTGMSLRVASFVLALVFGLAVCGCINAQSNNKEAPASDFNYDLSRDGKGVVITKYTGAGDKVVIPAKIEGLPVVRLEYSSFFGSFRSKDNAVTSVVIPASVKSIGLSAFAYSDYLTSVTIQGTGVEISVGAFSECKSLSELIFPNNENALVPVDDENSRGNGSFFGCKGLPLAMRAKLKAMGFAEP
jgi:hypothetical protein